MTEEDIKRFEEIKKILSDNHLESDRIEQDIKLLSERLNELRKEEILKTDELIKIEAPELSKFINNFVKVKDEFRITYMYVTSIDFNPPRISILDETFCALSGPYFGLSKPSKDESNKGYSFYMYTEHGSKHPSTVKVKNPKDVEIIRREEFIEAFDEIYNQSKQYFIESIDNKPSYKKDIERVINDRFSGIFKC